MNIRLLVFALLSVGLSVPAQAQVFDYPGSTPNLLGPGLDFDAAGISPGPATAAIYGGTGVTSILPFGSGWGVPGTQTYFGGYGQVLGLVAGTPTVVGALAQLDRPSSLAGWEIQLDAPVDEIEIRFSNSTNFGHRVELFDGATSLGTGDFGSTYQSTLRYYRAATGSFDRARITIYGSVTVGFDRVRLGQGPAPGPPGNDECNNALAVPQGRTPVTTRSGTESAEPWTCAGDGSADTWFRYDTATNGFNLEICLDQADFQTQCELYTGTCGALTLLECGPAGCGTFSFNVQDLVAGTRYWVRLGGSFGSRGAAVLEIAESNPTAPAPPNCLQTYFAADSVTAEGGVVYFDLETADDIVVDGLVVHTPTTGPIGLEVYAIAGSHVGNTSNPLGTGWTLVATDDGVATGLGQGVPTPVSFALPWELAAGTAGVAVIGRNPQTGATLAHAFSAGTPFNQEHGSGDGLVTMTAGAASDSAWSGSTTPAAVWNGRFCFERPTLGTRYCSTNANATGLPAVMGARGSLSLAANDLRIRGDQLPTNVFGFFITSRTQGFVPNPAGSSGNLCLGGSIGRYVGPGQIMNSGSNGAMELSIDNAQMPTPTGLVPASVGEPWNFALWFRDGGGGAPTSNFTDGLELIFQ